MGGKNTTISSEEPKLGNLRVQTSMYGICLPMVWGQTRVVGNLLWFGNFQAIAQTTTSTQGGKGGGGVTQVDTKYIYKAAAVLGLARGPILGIASAWKGKRRYTGVSVPGAKTLIGQAFAIPPGTSTQTVTVPAVETFGGTVSVTYIAPAPNYTDSGGN